MLKIRLQRIGRRNNPSYRVVVVESTSAAKKGLPVETIGFHDTVRKKTSIDGERVTYWLSKGARPSNTMHNILIANGVIEGVKRNVLPKKHPVVKSEEGDAGEGETAPEEKKEEEQPADESAGAEPADDNSPSDSAADDTPSPEETSDDAQDSPPTPSQEG